MIKQIPKEIDLEFEVGKTYKTKFQTGEHFTISKIISKPFLNTTKIIRFEGIYEKAPHLGDCPLDPDRLIPEKEIVYIEVEEKEFTRTEAKNILLKFTNFEFKFPMDYLEDDDVIKWFDKYI